ncbi:hypothetical protein F2Q69_00062958 [Brassica cretica]|uniref:Uncharacterized protein n=1 Tax=Brassica cretica TaxID=69181 RepID=A0A8S9RAM0_BRACR|nr:hypothetical protein F2Q69_00062958 [Brassica cretica]
MILASMASSLSNSNKIKSKLNHHLLCPLQNLSSSIMLQSPNSAEARGNMPLPPPSSHVNTPLSPPVLQSHTPPPLQCGSSYFSSTNIR